METIGVREIRQHATAYLRRVERGEAFLVTRRGKPVAVLASSRAALAEAARVLIAELVGQGAYPDTESALAAGVDELVREGHRLLADAATVEGYTRVPEEPDPWLDEATRISAAALDE